MAWCLIKHRENFAFTLRFVLGAKYEYIYIKSVTIKCYVGYIMHTNNINFV
jgi:hypothetical protein